MPLIPVECFEVCEIREVSVPGIFFRKGDLKDPILFTEWNGQITQLMFRDSELYYYSQVQKSSEKGIFFQAPSIAVESSSLGSMNECSEKSGTLFIDKGQLYIVAKNSNGMWDDYHLVPFWSGSTEAAPRGCIGYREWSLSVKNGNDELKIFEFPNDGIEKRE